MTTLHKEYTDKISSIAVLSLNQEEFNKTDYLLLTEDLLTLKEFLENELQVTKGLLMYDPTRDTWCRIVLLVSLCSSDDLLKRGGAIMCQNYALKFMIIKPNSTST